MEGGGGMVSRAEEDGMRNWEVETGGRDRK